MVFIVIEVNNGLISNREPLYNIEPDIHTYTVYTALWNSGEKYSFTYSFYQWKPYYVVMPKINQILVFIAICIKLLNFHLNDFILIKSYSRMTLLNFHFTSTMVLMLPRFLSVVHIQSSFCIHQLQINVYMASWSQSLIYVCGSI